jgi:predicted amidohydrolase
LDVKGQIKSDKKMEINIGKNSIVILIAFLITILSCTPQRTNPEKIAKLPDKVKVAAVQIGGYDKWLRIKEGCNPVELVVKYVERAAADGVQLVVFPEYHLGRISVPGPQTLKISKAAAENNIYVIVGCWEVFEDESFSSTALLFGRDGEIFGKYYKTHAAVDTYDELPAYSKPPAGKDKQWFIENDPEWIMKRGNNLPVFDLDFGRIGILICYDGYFPETYSVLSLKGAEIIVWINGRGGSIQEHFVRTFMEQNLVSMICTNQDYGAGTMLAQYPNTIDAICRQTGEDYTTAEFDLKRLRLARKNSRNFQQRRPELYKEITRSHPIWEDYKNIRK